MSPSLERYSVVAFNSARNSEGLVIDGPSPRRSQDGEGGASVRAKSGPAGQWPRSILDVGVSAPARSHAAA